MSTIPDLTQAADVADDDLLLKRDVGTSVDEKARADTVSDYMNSRLGAVAGSGLLYVTGGTASAQTVAMTPALTAYSTSLEITAQAGTANDGAFTLSIDGLPAVPVKLPDGSDPYAGAFSGIGKFRYDGTNFVLLNPNIARMNTVYTATGTADEQVVTFDPAPAAWTTSTLFYFRPVAANTGSATISNGVEAKTLKLMDGTTDLPAGYLQTSNIYGVWYDGTNAVVMDAPSVIQTASNSDGYATRYSNGDQVAWGRATITPTAADTFTNKVVDYALEFTGTTDIGEVDKSVQVSAVSTVAGTTLYGWGSSSATLSNSQLVLRIIRTNTTDSVVDWVVRGRWFL